MTVASQMSNLSVAGSSKDEAKEIVDYDHE